MLFGSVDFVALFYTRLPHVKGLYVAYVLLLPLHVP